MLSEIIDGVVLAARLLLSALFLVAGIAKLTTIKSVQQAIAEFGVPVPIVRPLSIVIALAEIGAALALLNASSANAGAYIIVFLLALFTLFIGLSLARGRRPDCNCFGQIGSARIGPGSIARNIVLIAVAMVIAWRTGSAHPSTGPVVLMAIGSIVLIVLLGGQFWMMSHLIRQNGRMLNRIESLEGNLPRDISIGIGAIRSTSAEPPFRWTRSEAAT